LARYAIKKAPRVNVEQQSDAESLSVLLADAILAARSDAIIAADQDGIIRFWNPGAQRLFGYPAQDAIGRSLDLIIPERLREQHWQGFRRVVETGNSRYGDDDVLAVPAIRKDGTRLSIEFTIIPLKAEQRIVGMAAIIRDVSKRFEEMRALKRKLAETTRAVD
jgi:PAS domain S-box-containing protein